MNDPSTPEHTQVHGIGLFLYYVDEALPGGANITATILCDVLRRIYALVPAAKEILLYVQADNCTENKNKVVFAVQEILVKIAMQEKGVKLRFENNYLMVNHTHEDIDQVFKCIADLIRNLDTITVEELREAIAKLNTKTGEFLEQITLNCAYDFHGLLDTLIDKELRYYMSCHQICLYWDNVPSASACAQTLVWSFRRLTQYAVDKPSVSFTASRVVQVPCSTRTCPGTRRGSRRTRIHSQRYTDPSTRQCLR